MDSKTLPNIDDLGRLPNARKAAALDLLFEPSAEIHQTLIPVIKSRQHTSYNELIESCRNTLVSIASKSTASKPDQNLLAILGSHPRLGAKKVESAQSAAEQAKLGGESEVLARLNREYEQRFPGLRYVVFVNGRGRPEIMDDMKARMDRGDFGKEVDAALHVLLPSAAMQRD
ncbi:hypothetical protein V2A60_002569 [Cordyceps javanica]|uniref:OHCU decarboxylase n=1 Tax=Cordyceps javanica TaxID=43265 RepID=A0A545UY79_9HYPO|nr:OHCU decarboxylase [Cordyceps javanica]TQW06268.1 OHCU decarboxylase [Cordyceps javanica]